MTIAVTKVEDGYEVRLMGYVADIHKQESALNSEAMWFITSIRNGTKPRLHRSSGVGHYCHTLQEAFAYAGASLGYFFAKTEGVKGKTLTI